MKNVLFLAIMFIFALTSCTKGDSILPELDTNASLLTSRSSGGSDDSSSSSSSTSSNNITLTATQRAIVEAVITAKYAGYRIKEAEQELEHGVVYYKVTIVSGKKKIKLLFNTAWKFVGEKN
jgi:uncharacterized membrane protein YkoI